jgi:hypothetical protein
MLGSRDHGSTRARHVRLDRVAGLLRRKELAIDIIEGEIRSAQQEVLLEAAKLVHGLFDDVIRPQQ